jgi:hypothetical protein
MTAEVQDTAQEWLWNRICKSPCMSFASTLPDSLLVVRCSWCVAGTNFMAMVAHKDGRYICFECAHTLCPGVPEYQCLCRKCIRLRREVNHSEARWTSC